MKEARPFMPFQWNLRVTTTVHNLYSILVGLSAIDHEAFELRLCDSVSSHNMIQILPKNDLSIFVFGLKITTSNGHNTLVGPIVNMASHGRPTIDALDVIKYDPCML